MLSGRTHRLRIIARVVIGVATICAISWVSGFPHTYDEDELPPQKKAKPPDTPHRMESNQIVVAVNTHASDAYEKIPPMLLLTNPVYHDTLLLLGDLEMDIGAFHVHDVLDRLQAELVSTQPDLQRYRAQLEAARFSMDLKTLKDSDAQKEKAVMDKLDKYKYLRILERAWELRPERSWYVFVDMNTYLVRPNLMAALGDYDPKDPLFFLNPSGSGDNTFMLSKVAMRKLIVERDVISKWERSISTAEHTSAIDRLSGAIESELGIGSNSTWPSISSFNPYTIPYGSDFWCEEVVALQSVPPELATDIWRLQRDRQEYHHNHDPLTFADLWSRFLQNEDLRPRDDWDNLSCGPGTARWNILFDNVGRAPSGEASWEACQHLCNVNQHCIQFSYSSIPMPNFNENGETKCHLSSSMRLGRYASRQKVGDVKDLTWKSGWRKATFEDWAKQQRCKTQQDR